MATNLGTAILDLAANVGGLQRDLNKAAASVQKFQSGVNKTLAGIGVGLSMAGFAAFLKSSMNVADNLNDLQKRTGMAAQDLFILQTAAEKSGSSIEGIDKIMSKLPKTMREASQGATDASEALKNLGMDPAAFAKSPMKFFEDLGAALAQFEDGVDKADYAIAILGKGGDKLIPVMEALAETRKRMEALGLTMTDEMLKNADQFNDALTDMALVAQHAGRIMSAELGPAMEGISTAFASLAKDGDLFVWWGQRIRDVLQTVAVLANWVTYSVREVARDIQNLIGTAKAWATDGVGAAVLSLQRWYDERTRAEADYDKRNRMILGIPEEAPVPTLWGGEANKRPAPKTQPKKLKPLTGGGEVEKLAKAQLKAQLDALKAQADAEKELGSSRLKMLEAYHSAGYISTVEYYDKIAAVQLEAYAAERAAQDAAIAKLADYAAKQKAGSAEQVAAIGEVHKAQAERDKREREFAETAQETSLKAIKAAEDYQRAIKDVALELASLKGNTSLTVEVQFEREFGNLRDEAKQRGDADAVKQIDALKKARLEQAAINDLRTQAGLITGNMQSAEARLQAQVESGSMFQLDALRKQSEERLKAVAELEKVVVGMEAVAAQSGNAFDIANAERFRAELELLRAEADLFAKVWEDMVVGPFQTFFEDILNGTKSVKEAFKDMVASILKEFNRIIAQNLAKQLAASMFGQGSATGGTGGGWLGTILSAIGGAIGMGGGGSGMGNAALYASAYGPISMNAKGGDIFPWEKSLVGEKGVEVFKPRVSGHIIPNDAISKLMTNAERKPSVTAQIAASDIGKLMANAERKPRVSAHIVPKDIRREVGMDEKKQPLLQRAEGGDIYPWDRSLVGERGVEVFKPRVGGHIIPNDVYRDLSHRRTQNITFNIHAADVRSVIAAESQVQARFAQTAKKGQRNL